MAQESVAVVLDDLRLMLNDAVATHGFACMGLVLIPDLFERFPPPPENPDPIIYLGVGDPNLPSAKQYAEWRHSQALEQVARNGPVETRLSQQWIVYMFTAWEHEFRARLAAAHGCSPNDLKYPLLGDLRRLRNDVVHHHGVATPGETGKCELLVWFTPGDVIQLRGEHFAEFVEGFPWDDMSVGPPKT